MTPFRAIVVGLAIGVILSFVITPEPAIAHHKRFLVENAYHNPNGGINPNIPGINIEWEMTGASNLVCSDYGSSYTSIPQAIRDAISSWESVLSGTQFANNCNGGRSATWFRHNNYPCGTSFGCVFWNLTQDATRGAWYVGSTDIYVNEGLYNYTYEGLRYVAAHELGHVLDLTRLTWMAVRLHPPIISVIHQFPA